MSQKRIVIAGGSGFIGRALALEFSSQGFEVVILTRSPGKRADDILEMAWDGKNAGAWVQMLDGAAAVINLTGKNINCAHTPENIRAITASRVDSVNAIAAALARLESPPRVWVQAGATGYYGDTGAVPCVENSPAGHNGLAEICCRWEDSFAAAVVPSVRKVTLRIGFVLGPDGGALPVLIRLTRCFLGGSVGHGRQYISWVHLADLVQMFATLVKRDNLNGIFNAVAPEPVTNAEFMHELRRVLHRPWSPPAPEFAVRLGAQLMGSEASLALVSQRCLPEKFLEIEFPYRFPHLRTALENLCR